MIPIVNTDKTIRKLHIVPKLHIGIDHTRNFFVHFIKTKSLECISFQNLQWRRRYRCTCVIRENRTHSWYTLHKYVTSEWWWSAVTAVFLTWLLKWWLDRLNEIIQKLQISRLARRLQGNFRFYFVCKTQLWWVKLNRVSGCFSLIFSQIRWWCDSRVYYSVPYCKVALGQSWFQFYLQFWSQIWTQQDYCLPSPH